MDRLRLSVPTLIAVLCLKAWTVAEPAAAEDRLAEADRLFERGALEAAGAAYATAITGGSEVASVWLRAGTLALWGNRLPEARERLEKASSLAPDNMETQARLGEVHYRAGDFAKAAEAFRAADQAARAAQLASFGTRAPYRVHGPRRAVVPFVQTDPLPVVELSVDGSEPALFVVDTGGGELILDPRFAEPLEVRRFGGQEGTFAGGGTRTVEYGRVESVALGAVTVRNVPVQLLPTASFAAVTGGRPVAGVLGTTLLRQFRFTLDYPRGQLVLERYDKPEHIPDEAIDEAIVVPFLLVGSHLIVAQGCVGTVSPLWLLVDTGLAGSALALPASTLRRAGIEVDGASFEGVGGAGAVSATPFVASRVCLGEATRTDVQGLAGVFPESLEHRHGFPLGGLISHGILKEWSVTFDAQKMEILLARHAGDTTSTLFPRRSRPGTEQSSTAVSREL